MSFLESCDNFAVVANVVELIEHTEFIQHWTLLMKQICHSAVDTFSSFVIHHMELWLFGLNGTSFV